MWSHFSRKKRKCQPTHGHFIGWVHAFYHYKPRVLSCRNVGSWIGLDYHTSKTLHKYFSLKVDRVSHLEAAVIRIRHTKIFPNTSNGFLPSTS